MTKTFTPRESERLFGNFRLVINTASQEPKTFTIYHKGSSPSEINKWMGTIVGFNNAVATTRLLQFIEEGCPSVQPVKTLQAIKEIIKIAVQCSHAGLRARIGELIDNLETELEFEDGDEARAEFTASERTPKLVLGGGG